MMMCIHYLSQQIKFLDSILRTFYTLKHITKLYAQFYEYLINIY